MQRWEGMAASGGIRPPDPHGAPGPVGVIATVNLQISYFTKTGTTIWGPVALAPAFFTGNTGVGNQNADPVVLYDHASRHYFVVMQEDHNSRLWINVAVSKTSDPRTSGAADWFIYRIDATRYASSHSAGGTNYGGDYPGLAVDAQALYVTYNMYDFLPSGNMSILGSDANGSQLTILNKDQLLGGTTPTPASLALSGQDYKPVTPFGGNPGNLMYMTQLAANSLSIIAVSDPLV